MKGNIIIIGGGLGGLFTGALLSKEGFSVNIFEKNQIIGGGLQTFKRGGESFETGMHILGGFRKGGSIHKLCSYLGILDKLTIKDVDKECMDSIHYFSDNRRYIIREGREGFINSLSRYFPSEKDAIKEYVDALYELTEEVDFFHLRSGEDKLFSHSESFLIPADEFISRYIKNEKLKDILSYMNPMYGGLRGHTPAYIHALINVLYINGPSRFVDGSMQLANALKDIIEANNGKIHAGQSVRHIEVVDRNIISVETDDSVKHSADLYISAIHPCSLLNIISENAFPRSYKLRLGAIPNTYSAFTVYIKLKKDSFPYINHTCYCLDDYGEAWDFNDCSLERWPHGFMYMTPPVNNQETYASKLIITAPMDFKYVKQWENSTVGNRGLEYLNWKTEQSQKLIQKLSRIFPNLTEYIDDMYTSSPLTIRDYYNVKEGSMYGFRKDCKDIALSQVPIYTKVKNLLLTGQNINLHGICGVPLTAINTAEAILGQNYLVTKINKSYKY